MDPDTGLTNTEVDVRRKGHGYNEVTEQKGHPVLKFLGKFWGVSAWMLELVMVLSAVLRKYSDLAVVSALLVVNAVLSFAQERRAAGVVETLRRRLQVSARVLRDSDWQVIPARELVPGDIVRIRPGDIIPADVKLFTGVLSVFSIVSARERHWFWKTIPSKTLMAALAADALAGTVLTFAGLPGLLPLPWWQTLAIFVYAMVSCPVVNDAVKVSMIKRLVPAAVT